MKNVLIGIILALAVGACGVKNDPKAPGGKSEYSRTQTIAR